MKNFFGIKVMVVVKEVELFGVIGYMVDFFGVYYFKCFDYLVEFCFVENVDYVGGYI